MKCIYSVAPDHRTTLKELSRMLRAELVLCFAHMADHASKFVDLPKAATMLGYVPTHRIADGLKEAMDWYVQDFAKQGHTAIEPAKS